MKILTLAARKGGVGKSTLLIHFAAIAQYLQNKKVALIDLDPQQSTAEWGVAANMIVLDRLRQPLDILLQVCDQEKVDLVFIDTSPNLTPNCLEAIALSDFVILPVRPSALDLKAIGLTLEACSQFDKQAGLILNQCPTSSPKLAREAQKALEAYDVNICPTLLHSRIIFNRALLGGGNAILLEPQGKATQELMAIWQWVESFIREVGDYGKE